MSTIIQNYPQGYIYAGVSGQPRSETTEPASTVVEPSQEFLQAQSKVRTTQDKIDSINSRIDNLKEKISEGRGDINDSKRLTALVERREELEQALKEYKAIKSQASRPGSDYGKVTVKPTTTESNTSTVRESPLLGQYSSEATSIRLGIKPSSEPVFISLNQRAPYDVPSGELLTTKTTPSGTPTSAQYVPEGVSVSKEAITQYTKPTEIIRETAIEREGTKPLSEVRATSEVFGNVRPLEAVEKTLGIITPSTPVIQSSYAFISPAIEVTGGLARSGTNILQSGAEAGVTAVKSVPSYLGIDVKKQVGVDESGNPVYESLSRKMTGEEALTVGLFATGYTPKIVSELAIGGLTTYGLITTAPKIFTAPSYYEKGLALGETAIYSLGIPQARGLLEVRSFTSEGVLKGTIAELPSTVGEPVRARQFLKEEGISPLTFDITESIPYASYGSKIVYPKGEYQIKDIIDISPSGEVKVIPSAVVDKSGAIILPEGLATRQVKTIVTDVFKPGRYEVIEGRATPTEITLLRKEPTTLYKPLIESTEAKITEFGLVTESTGQIPLIETSRFPFKEQKLTLDLKGGEQLLTPIEYSEYLMKKYPEYRGFGFDIETGSGGGATRYLIKKGKVIDIYSDIDMSLFDLKEGEGYVEKITPELVRYYKKNQGEDISPLLDKEYLNSPETVLAHELIHVEEKLSGSLIGSEKEAFQIMIDTLENRKEPSFLISEPELLKAKSTTTEALTLAGEKFVETQKGFPELKVETELKSAQQPLIEVSKDIYVGGVTQEFGRIKRGEIFENIIPTERGAVLIEPRIEKVQTTIGEFEPSKPIIVKSLGAEPETIISLEKNIMPSLVTKPTSSYRTVRPSIETPVTTRGISPTESPSITTLKEPEVTLLSEEAPTKVLESKTELTLDTTGKVSQPIPPGQSTLKGLPERVGATDFSRVSSTPTINRMVLPSRTMITNVRSTRELEFDYRQIPVTKSSLEIKSNLEPLNINVSKTGIEPITELEITPSIISKTGLELKQGLEQKQVLETKQVLELKQGLETRGEPFTSRTTMGIIFPPIEPPKIPKPIRRSKEDDRRFKLFVRERGKFKPVSVGDISTLELKGQDILRQTARASYKIQSETGETMELNLPSGFIRSKRERGVIVQPRELRISSRGEKEEITYQGIRSRARKQRLI